MRGKTNKRTLLTIVSLIILIILSCSAGCVFREKIIEEKDCILINYTMKYASNGTIIDTTYKEIAIKAGIYNENKSYS